MTLQTERIRTLEQVRAFVEGNGPAEIKLNFLSVQVVSYLFYLELQRYTHACASVDTRQWKTHNEIPFQASIRTAT